MSLQKPIWKVQTFVKRKSKRVGVKLLEESSAEHYYQLWKTVAKWGPYHDLKRLNKATQEANAMKAKLEKLWPCHFLVRGYKSWDGRVPDSE